MLDMVKAYSSACGRDLKHEISPRRPGDVAVVYADPAYAAAELGWALELSPAPSPHPYPQSNPKLAQPRLHPRPHPNLALILALAPALAVTLTPHPHQVDGGARARADVQGLLELDQQQPRRLRHQSLRRLMGDEHQTFHLDLGFSSHLTHTLGPARETERVLVQTETRRISTRPSVLRLHACARCVPSRAESCAAAGPPGMKST